jgi:hypothetical protein
VEETVRRLEQRLEALERSRRRWRFAWGAAVAFGLGTWLLRGNAPLAAQAQTDQDQPKTVGASRFDLSGPDGVKASVSMSKYRDLDNIEKQSIDFRDADGVLRARIAWFKRTPGVVPQSALTTFGIYAGEQFPVQVLPVD